MHSWKPKLVKGTPDPASGAETASGFNSDCPALRVARSQILLLHAPVSHCRCGISNVHHLSAVSEASVRGSHYGHRFYSAAQEVESNVPQCEHRGTRHHCVGDFVDLRTFC